MDANTNQEDIMQTTSKEALETTHTYLTCLLEDACLNDMERALVQDMRDLLIQVRKYPLIYKLEHI